MGVVFWAEVEEAAVVAVELVEEALAAAILQADSVEEVVLLSTGHHIIAHLPEAITIILRQQDIFIQEERACIEDPGAEVHHLAVLSLF